MVVLPIHRWLLVLCFLFTTLHGHLSTRLTAFFLVRKIYVSKRTIFTQGYVYVLTMHKTRNKNFCISYRNVTIHFTRRKRNQNVPIFTHYYATRFSLGYKTVRNENFYLSFKSYILNSCITLGNFTNLWRSTYL